MYRPLRMLSQSHSKANVEIVEPLIMDAISPLVKAIGAQVIDPAEAIDTDVELLFAGKLLAILRLPTQHSSLEHKIANVETEMGSPLRNLSYQDKRIALRLLEENGAFAVRNEIEQIAEALHVSPFTIYNYLNLPHTTLTH